MRISDLPRLSIGTFPTPLVRATRFTGELGGPSVWLKRDDLTGLGMGGNKVRKLEYLVGDALAKGSDVLITAGAAQSNHARLTAAAARAAGLESVLVLRQDEHSHLQGNLLLDRILGAELRFVDPSIDLALAMQEVALDLEKQGRRPYVIPVGGSNALGAVAYADCAREIAEQAAAIGVQVDCVLCASGSGGTHGGLVLGAQALGLPFTIWGVSVAASSDSLRQTVARVASEGSDLLGVSRILPHQVVVFDGYIGERYGVPTQAGVDAIKWLARSEGVLLDPVYTSKAMSGLIDLSRSGALRDGQNVVFLHTGGTPALFAYDQEILSMLGGA